jgi:hypothetical protein
VDQYEVSRAEFGLVRAGRGDAADGFDAQSCGRNEADVPSARVKQGVPRPDPCRDHLQDELARVRLAGVRKVEDLQNAVGGSNTESDHGSSFCVDSVRACFGFQAAGFVLGSTGRLDFGSLSTTSR